MFKKANWLLVTLATSVVTLAFAVPATSGVSQAATAHEQAVATTSSSAEGTACKAVNEYAAKTNYNNPEIIPTVPDPASAVKGKIFFELPILASEGSVPLWNSYLKQALADVGMKFVEYDGQASVDQYKAGMQQAIADHAAVVMTIGIPDNLLTQEIKNLHAAGIKYMQFPVADAGATPGLKFKNVDADVGWDNGQMGDILANDAICTQKGSAHVLYIEDTDVPQSALYLPAVKSTIAKCSTCSLEVQQSTFAQNATNLAGLVESDIQKDPSLNFIDLITDGDVIYLAPLKASHAIPPSIGMLGNGQVTAVMKDVQSGLVSGDIGAGINFAPWQWVDTAIRLITGKKLVKEVLPLRLLTKQNLTSLNTEVIYPPGYESKFLHLWGVKG
jgi:hypothetical protein